MLSLRLTRGARPAVLLRGLLIAAASAGAGFLLLSALGHAITHPSDTSASLARLAWCAVPLAAVTHLSVAACRTWPGGRPSAGFSAAGLGPARLALLGAAQIAMECLLGSVAALLAFLWWRDRLAGTVVPLPFAGILTLLAAVPLVGAATCALVLRPRGSGPQAADDSAGTPPGARHTAVAPSGLPWGAALTATGLVIEVYANHWTRPTFGSLLPLPGGLGRIAPAVLLGWALTAAGLVLAGPGLVQLSGRLLAACRPGALRLLAGRTLQREAHRIGPPLGVLCAAGSAALAVTQLSVPDARPLGPLTGLGAVLMVGCPAATVFTAAADAKQSRKDAIAALGPMGAPASLLRKATALRAMGLLAVLAPVTLAVGWLAALPLAP